MTYQKCLILLWLFKIALEPIAQLWTCSANILMPEVAELKAILVAVEFFYFISIGCSPMWRVMLAIGVV